MLRILGKASSINVRKVLLTCDELGLPYELEEWGTGALDIRTEEFAQFNPNQTIPVLDDHGFVLWESNTICRYLAHKYGHGELLPICAEERAKVEKWMDWQATDLNFSWRCAFMGIVRSDPTHADPVCLDASVREWNAKMQILEKTLSTGGPFIAGSKLTLADIVLALSINRWRGTPMSKPSLPHVQKYFLMLRQRAAFSKYCSDASV